MLVLTRKETDTIRIDGPCLITIVRIGAKSIKVGIEAPRETKIMRGELVPALTSTLEPVMTTPVMTNPGAGPLSHLRTKSC